LRVNPWYLGCPIAASRAAICMAEQFVHPAVITVQPATGFQVESVHSIELSAIANLPHWPESYQT